jgi:hypothetical protein
MKSNEYIKQLESANQLLQQKLEDAHLKLEEGVIREKCLQLRPKRIWTLNGYNRFKTAKEYAKYKNKPFPDNAEYPDYMYWTMATDKNTERNEDFCRHFIYQMRLFMGIAPVVGTNCREPWLDDKIMEMNILVFSWYRVPAMGRIFREYGIGVDYIHNSTACRRYIIEKGNPEVYYYRGKGKKPSLTTAIRIQP